MPLSLTLITEDVLSETVARKILETPEHNFSITTALHWNKDKIRQKISAINRASQGSPFVVFTDQDTEERCPPVALQELPESPRSGLLYRFAVMEVESWVLADRQAIAEFLCIPGKRIPEDTDAIPHPKEFLVRLAGKSRSRRIQADIAPHPNSTSRVGLDYNGMLGKFVRESWEPQRAASNSSSLYRALYRVQEFAGRSQT